MYPNENGDISAGDSTTNKKRCWYLVPFEHTKKNCGHVDLTHLNMVIGLFDMSKCGKSYVEVRTSIRGGTVYLQLQYGDSYFRVRFRDREAENAQTEFQVTSVTLFGPPAYECHAPTAC